MNQQKTAINKHMFIAYALWLFLGWFGAHRLYTKKYISGIIMMILGIVTVFYYKEIILYMIARIIWLFSESANPLTVFPAVLIYLTIPLATGIVVIFTWWLIDLPLVYRYVKSSNQQPSKVT